MKRQEVKAISEDDLLDMLKSINKYDDFINNQCYCAKCGKLVNMENIHSIKKSNGDIIFHCNEMNCIEV